MAIVGGKRRGTMEYQRDSARRYQRPGYQSLSTDRAKMGRGSRLTFIYVNQRDSETIGDSSERQLADNRRRDAFLSYKNFRPFLNERKAGNLNYYYSRPGQKTRTQLRRNSYI